MGFRLALLMASVFIFAACGKTDFQGPYDRQVASTVGEAIPVDEDGDIENQKEEEAPLISLRSKVLANSDLSEKALDNAFDFFIQNHMDIPNQKYISIFDISQYSGNRRLYIINMETGNVSAIHTAHAKNSDVDHDGWATEFSNVNGSNKSSLGFMITAEEYVGKHGRSLRMVGLESRNSNVRSRAIVIHGASYVDPSWDKMGRSLGCPAVSMDNINWVVDALKEGSLFYIYHPSYDN